MSDPILSLSFTAAGDDEVFTEEAIVFDGVQDIVICEFDEETEDFDSENESVADVVGGSVNAEDIIPPFYYFVSLTSFGYFAGQNFDAEGEALLAAGCEVDVASLTITAPASDGETLSGEYTFAAEYVDDDETFDAMRWAIRPGAGGCSGETLVGNVDGSSDLFDYDGAAWSATVDMSDWEEGEYCLVLNPAESSGDDFREIRTFLVEEPPVEYAPYCGDGIVNQTWETCDGGYVGDGVGDVAGGMCNAQCQYVEKYPYCTDLTLAQVDIEEYENFDEVGDMTDDIYLGNDTNPIPNGAWFMVYHNGEYAADSDIDGYEDVPGLAVQREAGSVRARIHGGHEEGGKEHVNGSINFWSYDDEVAAESVASDEVGNNKLDGDWTDGSGIGKTKTGDDEAWVEDDVAHFVMTVRPADDGFYAYYDEPVDCPVCETADNLISNHSFEEPVVTKKRGWDLMTPVDWIVETLDGDDPTDIELHRGVNGWDSSDGEQHTELGTTEAVRVSQTVETIPGEEYTLSWDYSARPGEDKPESKMKVRVDGIRVATNNRNGQETTDWRSRSHTFIAESDETTVSFEDAGGKTAGKGPFLDNVYLGCMPAEVVCAVEGYKYDSSGNPLEGWTIGMAEHMDKKDMHGEGEAPSPVRGIVGTDVTDEYGYYCIAPDVEYDEEGEYLVYELYQPGWTIDWVEVDHEVVEYWEGEHFDAFVHVELDEEESTWVDFYNRETYIIEGYKWDDLNQDGYWDQETEPAIPGWEIYLEQVRPNIEQSSLEDLIDLVDSLSGDGVISAAYSTTTDATGHYYFEVDAGWWEVYEEERDGWYQTAPGMPVLASTLTDSPETDDLWGDDYYGYCSYHFSDDDDQDIVRLPQVANPYNPEYCDFGNYYEGDIYEVYGYKWNDEDGNGEWDTETESALAGWTILLTNGETTLSTTTDSDGYYFFDFDESGEWTVSEVEQTGWTQRAPVDGSCTANFGVEEENIYSLECDFGNQLTSIEATGLSCDFFAADETSGEEGAPNRLTWNTTGAVDVAISDAIDLDLSGLPVDGSTDINLPDIQTLVTYTLTATDTFANQVTCTTSVEVTGTGSGSDPASASVGQVLGESISIGGADDESGEPAGQVAGEQCSMYLTDYLRIDLANDSFEVTKLQMFLTQQGYPTPVTGIFDVITENNVKLFQTAHSDDVLQPWLDLGAASDLTPSGYVFKTTRWKINDLACPGSESYPDLP